MLYRSTPDTVDRTLAFALGAAVLFIVANAFPIVGMTIEGRSNNVSLPGARSPSGIRTWDWWPASWALTVLFAPCLELVVLLYLLTPLKFGGSAPGGRQILRALEAIHPWGLVEVFMLGILVSLVKLGCTPGWSSASRCGPMPA